MRITHLMLRPCCLLLCCVLLQLSAADQFQFLSTLEGFKPSHSGLLITEILPNSQALRAGLKQGDIIVSYNDQAVTSLEALATAKEGVQAGHPCNMIIQRQSRAHNIDILGGSIGCHIYQVSAGKAIQLRPPQTPCQFDIKRIQQNPQILNQWYRFVIDGKHVGYEHIRLEHDPQKHIIRSISEVAFDGGPQWGLNHFIVSVSCDDQKPFRARSVSFHTPLSDFTASSKRITAATGGEHWSTTYDYKDERGTARSESFNIPLPSDGIPSYVVLQLASLLEREPGACFHFTSLVDGTGQRGMPSALIVDKRERLSIDGQDIDCTRCDSVSLQGTSSAWLDDQHRIVQMQFGPNTFAYVCERKHALQGIRAELKPRTKTND